MTLHTISSETDCHMTLGLWLMSDRHLQQTWLQQQARKRLIDSTCLWIWRALIGVKEIGSKASQRWWLLIPVCHSNRKWLLGTHTEGPWDSCDALVEGCVHPQGQRSWIPCLLVCLWGALCEPKPLLLDRSHGSPGWCTDELMLRLKLHHSHVPMTACGACLLGIS